MIEFYSLNGAEQVTGSSHIIEINKKKFMLDCGAEQGMENANQHNREVIYPDDIKGVILSHSHFDHSGLLPKLIKDGYTGKIYSTPVTRDLSSIVLQDSAKIQTYENSTPIYTEREVLETMNHFRCSVYGKEKKIDDDLKYSFYNSGHILGSAFINLSMPKYTNPIMKILKKDDMINVLYAVDFGRKDSPICNPPETNIVPPDYIILESTYGNKTHNHTDTIYQELAYIVNRTIERGGKVIIPSFAVNRTQELIYFIKKLMRGNKIPRVPVYIDSPMAANVCGVYNCHSECFNQNIIEEFTSKGKNPFSVRTLKFVTDYRESVRLAKSTKPAIIISCNGMCENGRIISHIKYGIENPNNTILFVGYQAKNTLGRKILDKNPSVSIDHKDYELKCEIHSIPAFSSHGDYVEMINWLKEIDTSKLKTVFLVHGDIESLNSFKERLEKEFPKINFVISKKGERYRLK